VQANAAQIEYSIYALAGDEMAHVDFAGHSSGDQRGAMFAHQFNGAPRFADKRVNLRGFGVEIFNDGALFGKWWKWSCDVNQVACIYGRITDANGIGNNFIDKKLSIEQIGCKLCIQHRLRT